MWSELGLNQHLWDNLRPWFAIYTPRRLIRLIEKPLKYNYSSIHLHIVWHYTQSIPCFVWHTPKMFTIRLSRRWIPTLVSYINHTPPPPQPQIQVNLRAAHLYLVWTIRFESDKRWMWHTWCAIHTHTYGMDKAMLEHTAYHFSWDLLLPDSGEHDLSNPKHTKVTPHIPPAHDID